MRNIATPSTSFAPNPSNSPRNSAEHSSSASNINTQSVPHCSAANFRCKLKPSHACSTTRTFPDACPRANSTVPSTEPESTTTISVHHASESNANPIRAAPFFTITQPPIGTAAASLSVIPTIISPPTKLCHGYAQPGAYPCLLCAQETGCHGLRGGGPRQPCPRRPRASHHQ